MSTLDIGILFTHSFYSRIYFSRHKKQFSFISWHLSLIWLLCLSCFFSFCVIVILTSYSLELYLQGVSEAREYLPLPDTCGHCQSGAPLNENIPRGLSRALREAWPSTGGHVKLLTVSPSSAHSEAVQGCVCTALLQDRLFWGACFYETYPDLTLSTCGPGLAMCPSLAISIKHPGPRHQWWPSASHPWSQPPLWLTFLSGFWCPPPETSFSVSVCVYLFLPFLMCF